MSGNFLSCSKDPYEFPEFRCDEPPDASEEMGLISPGGENLLDFLELGRVSRVTTGTTGTRSGGLRKGQCPWELQGSLSGFLSRRCRGLRPCVESGLEPEVSSPVLTWIWGTFGVSRGESVLVSSYEGEMGLLWMWAGLSCFLSSGDGYVGELLELQQGPF